MHYSILDLRINEKALRKNWLILIKLRVFVVELKLSLDFTCLLVIFLDNCLQGESKKCPLVRKVPLLLTDIF